MAGHIEFRYYSDAALPRISKDFAHLLLRVVKAIGTHFLQLRKALALDTEALIF